MPKTIRRRYWWKLVVAMVTCGSLFQSGACSQDLSELAQSWTTSVADQYIVLYFNDRFNAPSSFF